MPSPRPCASSADPGCCLPYVTKTRSPIVWIPNGAKCCGSLGSTNAPGVFTWFQLPSNTSTLPLLAKSVAYSRGPDGPFEMARPLNTAPDEDMSTVTCAAVEPMRHALMVPSSLSNTKFDVSSAVGSAAVPTWNWPLMPENFSFFLLEDGKPVFFRLRRDFIDLGGDYTLYNQHNQPVGFLDGKVFSIGGKWKGRVKAEHALGRIQHENGDMRHPQVSPGHHDAQLFGHQLRLALASDTSRVDENEVRSAAFDLFVDRVARGARDGGNNGALFSQKGVEQNGAETITLCLEVIRPVPNFPPPYKVVRPADHYR